MNSKIEFRKWYEANENKNGTCLFYHSLQCNKLLSKLGVYERSQLPGDKNIDKYPPTATVADYLYDFFDDKKNKFSKHDFGPVPLTELDEIERERAEWDKEMMKDQKKAAAKEAKKATAKKSKTTSKTESKKSSKKSSQVEPKVTSQVESKTTTNDATKNVSIKTVKDLKDCKDPIKLTKNQFKTWKKIHDEQANDIDIEDIKKPSKTATSNDTKKQTKIALPLLETRRLINRNVSQDDSKMTSPNEQSSNDTPPSNQLNPSLPLSKLSRSEILKLPGFGEHKTKSLAQLKIILRNNINGKHLRRGATVADYYHTTESTKTKIQCSLPKNQTLLSLNKHQLRYLPGFGEHMNKPLAQLRNMLRAHITKHNMKSRGSTVLDYLYTL